ncbi:hypothetical protein [Vagococcus fluvialis]|uniref:hypothetical protein n=1 Tax=Vagococcus fluvialis TaxID=2738 RepID=UPI0037A89A99
MCEYCEVSDEGCVNNILYDVTPSTDFADDLLFGCYVYKSDLIMDCWKPNLWEEGELEEHSVRNKINYCPMCGRNLKERSNEL